MLNSSVNNRQKSIKLPDNLKGRNINNKIIPTVCNLKNMLNKLFEVDGDFIQLKPWEKRSYKAYRIDEIYTKLLFSGRNRWAEIIRNHILSKSQSEFGPSCIDIYLVGYVSETYGKGKERIFQYVKEKNISEKENSAQAIWQVGKGDGIFLGILNEDGTIKDWDFIKKWVVDDNIKNNLN